ncbi:DUF1835 domain-containing protein [Chitinophaga horti]|uniref:DUF1835 domain-containing protein n=1 Tax=Chitinophaga horti TaxID=2920382 RepID=A0ABY6J1A3_9BACT|nr:DUF1835 domain-containing protein [Chitinophaga horti]UYQ93425.1 DUF1835 domain-containing protein [Chitinophaga horti]
MNYLHVLNGDATLEVFRKSGIPGDFIVCREMISEGRVAPAPDADTFLTERAAHLREHYGIDTSNYNESIVKELGKLKQAGNYDELVLWFEFDVFCQLNLLFVLWYLRQLNIQLPPVSLVSINHHPEVVNFKGFGVLLPHHYPPLFEQRAQLREEDWQLALDTWNAYTGDDPSKVNEMRHRAPGNLPFLAEALQAQLQRLPYVEDGLNVIQRFFLQNLQLGCAPWYNLYNRFWNELKIYGFGDFQLDIITQRMRNAGVIEGNEQMCITSLGQEVLAGEENYTGYAALDHWIGGTPLHETPWRWSAAEDKPVKVS